MLFNSGFTGIFGAEKISFDQITRIKDSTPDIIVWAAPVMFFLVAVELIVSHLQNRGYYHRKETIGSVLVGIGNVAVSLSIKLALLYAAVWMYNLVPWRMELNWWTFIPCYIIFDLCSYWAHNVSHNQRFWWATHVTHHSGEDYNLSTSFRLSWMQYLKIIFMLPVALLGFHPVIFFVTNQIAILFQFCAHTEYIRKMPRIIEYVFATPSNHRVHHGSQEKYINKNYGATFIFWDRLFGTYQAEEEPAVYGITSNIGNKSDPLHINFHEYADMIRDVKAAKGWRQKWFFMFGNPINIARAKQRMAERKNVPVAAEVD